MGTSVSLVGGGLTIAGGILTIATAGVATPVLIAGIHTLGFYSKYPKKYPGQYSNVKIPASTS